MAHKKRGRVRRWIQSALGVRERRLKKGPHHRKAIRKEAAHKGALHRQLGIPIGQKIPLALLYKYRHASGKLGKRVRFAINARKFRHRGHR